MTISDFRVKLQVSLTLLFLAKTMKKTLLIITLVAVFSLTASVASAYYPREGDLVKTTRNSAVYYIDGGGYRHLFPTESTFFSWHKGSWSNQTVLTLSESDFLSLPVGKNVTVKAGYSLIKFDNSLKIYAVLPSGKLCQAPAHYGNYQYNRALTIPSGFESDYYNDRNCDITESQKLPDGTLLRYYGSSDVYYIQNGLKRKVTETGFNENNFRWESVINDVSWSMSYNDGNTIYGKEDSLSKVGYNLYYNNYNYNCSENWTCGTWGSCTNGYRNRSCWDQNYCGTYRNKPIESETCSTCYENWSCNNWSTCAYGRQYRSCWDNNRCGTTNSKPIESQTCSSCTENWSCTAWSICSGGKQYRSCLDVNRCGTSNKKPLESQTCR